MSWFSRWVWGPKSSGETTTASVDRYVSPPTYYTGSKYPGGVGGMVDSLVGLDYWTLRSRSAALFATNSYARGIIRRLVTNVIHSGLEVEAIPEEALLGLPEDTLTDWSEDVENRFSVWGRSKRVCDARGLRSFGDIQKSIYREALIGGDCLVIIRQDEVTFLPQIEVIPGDRVRTPNLMQHEGQTVVDGVHLDARGRHLGYWVYHAQEGLAPGEYRYIPARGERTNRLQAWLVYGVDKREDGVRGEPLLGIAIQPLREIDNYRDSAQRKAWINSIIVGFVKRPQAGPSSLPLQGGALRKTNISGDTADGKPISVAEMMPGVYIERLQPGEEPTPYAINGADVNFKVFESAIMVGLAWALEIPPEILMLSFDSNYSASQAALNEFKLFLTKERSRFGAECLDPVYQDWFLSEVLIGKIRAPGFLEAYSDPMRYDEVQAWLTTDWSGAIKPTVDIVKQVSGYKMLTGECWITNDRASRELTGTKYTKNVRRLRKENELKMEAIRPLLEAQKEFGKQQVTDALGALYAVPSAEDDSENERVGHDVVDVTG